MRAIIALLLLALLCGRAWADDAGRGRYLVTVGDCIACHTAPGGAPFAGGRPIATPFGTLRSANITPDRASGIGGWSDADFDRALRRGIAPGGKRLYPACPFPYFTRASGGDIAAIHAYLQSLAPVRNEVQADVLPFPFDIRALMRGWDAVFFHPGAWRDDPAREAAWNRGGYLVEGLGHCGACHTAKNALGADETRRALQGGLLQGWWAPGLTPAARTGLAGWTIEGLIAYLRTGSGGGPRGPRPRGGGGGA
jgi:mono/diheme cytochrome c family protein